MNGLFESTNRTVAEPKNSLGVRVIQSNETSEKAKQEALHWLIALQEDPEDADALARFKFWHASSAENKRAWHDAQHVWNVLGEAREVSKSTSIPSTVPSRVSYSSQSKARQRRSWSLSPRHFGLAAIGLMGICLAVLLQPTISIWLVADYSTTTAEIREIRLEDGSVVHLGADSAIQVAFEPGIRRVRLLSGEAYFEVEPDRTRPFQVGSGNIETTVLGTAFDVRMMTDGVAVAVNHGRVGVAARQTLQGLETPLEAGDWVRVGWSGEIERGEDAPELVGGWRTGMLVVKDWPISEVVDEIRRHFSGKIVLADNKLGKQRVTGVYDLRKPVEALRAVAEAHGGNAREISSWVTVVSRY